MDVLSNCFYGNMFSCERMGGARYPVELCVVVAWIARRCKDEHQVAWEFANHLHDYMCVRSVHIRRHVMKAPWR
jgi:hypothetical protein